METWSLKEYASTAIDQRYSEVEDDYNFQSTMPLRFVFGSFAKALPGYMLPSRVDQILCFYHLHEVDLNSGNGAFPFFSLLCASKKKKRKKTEDITNESDLEKGRLSYLN